jgi:preprotein translocase subunit SecG
MISFLLYLFVSLFITVGVILIMLVLIQKGRGGGLSGAFGGGGGNTAFGSKTGDVLTWATSIVFGVFVLLAIILNLVAEKYNAQKLSERQQQQQQQVLPPGSAPGGPAGQLPASRPTT